MAVRAMASELAAGCCKKLGVAGSAMAIAAAGGGIAATAAQAQNEVLTASATTFTGGASGLCVKGSATAIFNASGPATGLYPGTFTETNANATVSAPTYTTRTLTLSIPFTISSGGTTITGTTTNPSPYSGGTLLCYTGSFDDGGPIVNASAAAYTATIQSNGQPTRTVSGTAQVSAAFEFRPQHVVGAPPTVTLLNFPSPPVVSTVSPGSGPSTGGTPIEITGNGFVTGDRVVIGQGNGWAAGAIAATGVSVVSSTEITATTGGGAKPGTWFLWVIAPDGTVNPHTSGAVFTYIGAA
jgi:IPT/TIG domain